jgi:ribosomal protein S18 acetylase RimI-like enzyme
MNTHSLPTIRSACSYDAEPLAKLIDIAGEGIPSWFWGQQCAEDQQPLEFGAERAKRPTGGFSFTNALLAERNDQPLGMVLSYAVDDAPEDDPEDLPAPFAPFVVLEKLSVGTWYVNALAVFPGCRNQGLGTQLLTAVENLARENGADAISIQVFGQNTDAVRLYRRRGYEFAASAPVRLHPCQPYYSGDVLLLIKQL